ncbi:MAG: helix-turn-helix domain-containing protein [Carboxylicivirga sp.]|jgi:excisionase family DNA binding protein|nr:helix-turn-helix domain-containing protein [Carboxylicivirga sp.]
MSSNLKIEKICEWCNNKFIARTTTTKYCSHKCNSKAYKDRQRKDKAERISTREAGKYSDEYIAKLNNKAFLKVQEVAILLGLSKQTIYNLIYSNQLKASKLSPRITIIKKSDIDDMFEKAKSNKINPTKASDRQTEYYSLQEIKDKYRISNTWLYKIAKEKNVPKLNNNGQVLFSKSHIDRLLRKRNEDQSEISDWANTQQLCDELKMTTSAFHSFISRVGVPKKRDGRTTYYSRKHVLTAKGIIQKEAPEFYTTDEAIKAYGLSRDSLYSLIKKNDINKIRKGRYILISRNELDNLLKP